MSPLTHSLRIRRLLLLLLVAAVASGCPESESRAGAPECLTQSRVLPGDFTAADDTGCAVPCDTDDACPLGTVCAECPLADIHCVRLVAQASCEEPAVDDRFCLLPDNSRVALVDGFEVPEFRLHDAFSGDAAQDDDGSLLLEFQAPDGTQHVSCALFGCPPIVEKKEDRHIISNFDECVVAFDTFSGNRGFFDLTRDDYLYPTVEERRACTESDEAASQPRLATHLIAGCWAYGFGSVLAASVLVPVPAEDTLHPYHGGHDDGLADFDACDACRLDGLIGAKCGDADCQLRCVSASDCQSGGDTEVECRHQGSVAGTFNYLGICHEFPAASAEAEADMGETEADAGEGEGAADGGTDGP